MYLSSRSPSVSSPQSISIPLFVQLIFRALKLNHFLDYANRLLSIPISYTNGVTVINNPGETPEENTVFWASFPNLRNFA